LNHSALTSPPPKGAGDCDLAHLEAGDLDIEVKSAERELLELLSEQPIEYPALKRAVREQQSLFGATVVLIEDKASGTQLIQELITEGCHGATRYQPTGDKTMRLNARTAVMESGFVHIPETAPWLAEYLHELTVFPNGKHDDQADSTAQFLDWCKKPFPGQGIFEFYRQCAQEIEEQRKPQPVKTVWAIGSMEWQAEQEKARSAAAPDPEPQTPPDID
jgi:predicted phage terminase large subunit-like protein